MDLGLMICSPAPRAVRSPTGALPSQGRANSGGSHVDSLMSYEERAHVAALPPVEMVPGRWMQPYA